MIQSLQVLSESPPIKSLLEDGGIVGFKLFYKLSKLCMGIFMPKEIVRYCSE